MWLTNYTEIDSASCSEGESGSGLVVRVEVAVRVEVPQKGVGAGERAMTRLSTSGNESDNKGD
jgi:hypothetical protein